MITAADIMQIILATRIKELEIELEHEEMRTFPNIDRKNLLNFKITRLKQELIAIGN